MSDSETNPSQSIMPTEHVQLYNNAIGTVRKSMRLNIYGIYGVSKSTLNQQLKFRKATEHQNNNGSLSYTWNFIKSPFHFLNFFLHFDGFHILIVNHCVIFLLSDL